MGNKFEKVSIYDVDIKLQNDEGQEEVFTFKPLPFATYPEVYDVLSQLSEIDFEKTNEKDLLRHFGKDLTSSLMNVEKVMVMNSYPDMDEGSVERFVVSNTFLLIDALVQLTFKQEKASPRKMEQAKNG